MRAGRLSHRIKFQRRQAGDDSFGSPNGEWQDLAECWAAVEPLTGREYFAAQQVQADTAVRITIRYQTSLSGLTTKDRVVFGNRTFDIRSVIDVRERHTELQVMCTEHQR